MLVCCSLDGDCYSCSAGPRNEQKQPARRASCPSLTRLIILLQQTDSARQYRRLEGTSIGLASQAVKDRLRAPTRDFRHLYSVSDEASRCAPSAPAQAERHVHGSRVPKRNSDTEPQKKKVHPGIPGKAARILRKK